MLWTLLLGLILGDRVITTSCGYYQEYHHADASSNDPYTRAYYASSQQQAIDQHPSSSSNSLAYAVTQPGQDSMQQFKLPAYSSTMDEQNYPAVEDLPSYQPLEEHHFQPLSYEPAPQPTLPPPTALATSYREYEPPKIEVGPTPTEVHSYPSYHPVQQIAPAPQTTIHVNAEPAPIPLSQHIQITRHVPVPVVKPIPIPVAKPFRVEVPHPIIIPIPKPYQIKVPVVHPVAVPLVREVTIPVEKVIPFPVEKRVPYTVEKHIPYKVEKHITVQVPQPYPVRVPIIKTIIHKVKTYGRLNYNSAGWK